MTQFGMKAKCDTYLNPGETLCYILCSLHSLQVHNTLYFILMFNALLLLNSQVPKTEPGTWLVLMVIC
jgi:hypothetical protein